MAAERSQGVDALAAANEKDTLALHPHFLRQPIGQVPKLDAGLHPAGQPGCRNDGFLRDRERRVEAQQRRDDDLHEAEVNEAEDEKDDPGERAASG